MLFRCSLPAVILCSLLTACRSASPSTGHDGGPLDGGPTDGGVDAGLDAGPPPGSPGAPTLSGSSTPSPGAVHLIWVAADGLADGFRVYRSSFGGAFSELASVDGTTLSYTDSTVALGTPYAYEVAGSDSAGVGALSNEVDLLAAPFDANAGGSDTRVIVYWGAIDGANSYDVYRVPDAGAAMLLGNAPGVSFVDDGSVAAIATGASYSYDLVAKSSTGALASIASNVAATTALGLDVTANQIFISDVGEEAQSLASVLALQARNVDGGPLLDDAGFAISFPSLSTDTALIVPGVPFGTYAITVASNRDYIVSSARALDFSQATVGRSDAQPAGVNTQIAYSLTGLSPWTPSRDGGLGDAVEKISVGAGDFAANLAADIATPPDAGATVFAGTETLGAGDDAYLLDADAGDALYLFQLHAKESSNGIHYLAPSATDPDHSVTTVSGTTNSISAALQATSAIPIASIDFPLSAYLDPAHATLNPAATNPRQRVYLELEKGFSAHGWYSNDSLADGLILDVPQDAGTLEADGGVDVNAGALAWADPVAPSWDAFVLIQSAYDVPFTVSFTDTGAVPPKAASASTTFTSYSSITAPMPGTAFANSLLLPTLSAPRSPLLTGASQFSPQSSISPTSTLSWSAPALGTAGYYLVVIYAIEPQTNADGTFVTDGSGDYLVDIVEQASFTTKSQSVQLAADLLPAQYNFFATIDAVTSFGPSGAIDATLAPYTLGATYSSMQTVTASFTVAQTLDRQARQERTAQAAPRQTVRPGALAKGGRARRSPLGSRAGNLN